MVEYAIESFVQPFVRLHHGRLRGCGTPAQKLTASARQIAAISMARDRNATRRSRPSAVRGRSVSARAWRAGPAGNVHPFRPSHPSPRSSSRRAIRSASCRQSSAKRIAMMVVQRDGRALHNHYRRSSAAHRPAGDWRRHSYCRHSAGSCGILSWPPPRDALPVRGKADKADRRFRRRACVSNNGCPPNRSSASGVSRTGSRPSRPSSKPISSLSSAISLATPRSPIR